MPGNVLQFFFLSGINKKCNLYFDMFFSKCLQFGISFVVLHLTFPLSKFYKAFEIRDISSATKMQSTFANYYYLTKQTLYFSTIQM